MKKFASFLLALVIVMSLTTVAFASSYQADVDYQYSRSGIVHCSRVTVRSGPSSNNSGYGKLRNGQTCTIVGETDGWWIIDLASCGFADYTYGYGYAKKDLISVTPSWIVVDPYTYLYTDPWYSGKLNGEQYDRIYLVISESQDFYCVQCTEDAAGSSFIRKCDVPRYSQDWQNLYVIPVDGVPLYDNPNGYAINTLSRYTIVNVESWDGYGNYYVRVLSDTDYEYCGWVNQQYVQKIIN